MARKPNANPLVRPGAALKAFRSERGMTLADLSQKTGMQASTLSKLENGKAELTIDKLLRISLALDINIADFFTTPTDQFAARPNSGIRSITRAGEGTRVDSPGGSYTYQAYDLLRKNFTPMIAEIRARSLEEFGPFHRHAGEEFIYVIEGELAFYSDIYTPVHIRAGDTLYFDSGMGHAYVAAGDGPCRILSVFSTPADEALELVEGTRQESGARSRWDETRS